MKIISFAWTTPALLAGAKVVTRRQWADRYAAGFKVDDYVQAWDKSPRVKGAKRVAVIQLIETPWKEAAILMDQEDYLQEGLFFLSKSPHLVPEEMKRMLDMDGYGKLPGAMWHWFQNWRETAGELWVVRFKVIEYVGAPVPGLPEQGPVQPGLDPMQGPGATGGGMPHGRR